MNFLKFTGSLSWSGAAAAMTPPVWKAWSGTDNLVFSCAAVGRRGFHLIKAEAPRNKLGLNIRKSFIIDPSREGPGKMAGGLPSETRSLAAC